MEAASSPPQRPPGASQRAAHEAAVAPGAGSFDPRAPDGAPMVSRGRQRQCAAEEGGGGAVVQTCRAGVVSYRYRASRLQHFGASAVTCNAAKVPHTLGRAILYFRRASRLQDFDAHAVPCTSVQASSPVCGCTPPPAFPTSRPNHGQDRQTTSPSIGPGLGCSAHIRLDPCSAAWKWDVHRERRT